MNVATIHPFERAGLGQAPFRFVGMVFQDLRYGERILNRAEYEKTGIATTTAPGGSCAYCGTYIRHMYGIESADGKSFHVGSECVNKTNDRKLISAAKIGARKVLATRVEIELDAILSDEQARGKLHNAAGNKSPYSLLSTVEWFRKFAGVSGKKRILKIAKAVL